MINEAIIRLREMKGMSQASLAGILGMKRAQLCVIEKGKVNPTAATVARIAKALGVGPDVLMAEPHLSVDDLVPTRRAVAGLVAARQEVEKLDAALDSAEKMRGVVSATTLPLVHAYLHEPHAGEILAQSLRSSLRVGMAAFSDLVWTLEFANVRVWSIDLPKSESSAGWWCPTRGTLTLTVDSKATPERQLYRLAYELGVACLFRSSGDRPLLDTKREHRLFAEFAAAFLMPAVAIADMVAKAGIEPKAWTFGQLLTFKAHFGVSAETFALRLQELGLIDKRLRESFRAKLRAYYKSHPRAMEPAPSRPPLQFGLRQQMIGGERSERGAS